MRLRLRHSREPLPEGLFERAVAGFNASEPGRAVAGLTRTLGTPRVSVGASAGSSEVVRITVAWELSWYQWGVDAGAGAGPVTELAKGREVGELDGPARQWNASVDAAGHVVLTAPPRPPAFATAVR